MGILAPSKHPSSAARLLGWLLPFLLLAVPPLEAGEIGLDIFGFSYHFDRRDETGKRFNEFNYGAGGRYILYSHERSSYSLEGAIYYDSFRYTAKFGAFGYDYRIIEQLSLGVLVGLIDSRSVSASGWIIGAVPLLRYRWRAASFNLIYLPEFPGINEFPGVATYLTIWLGKAP